MPKSTLKKLLSDNLKEAKRIAVLGVGSELRADDIAGMLVAEKLDKSLKTKKNKSAFRIFYGATAPENFTGEIKKYNPTHLVIVDAADTGAEPGTIILIKPEELAGISFSTHVLPLKIMTDYILQSINCSVTIIGIQPKILQFGKKCSREVKDSANQVSKVLEDILSVIPPISCASA